jgi:hypothetical protein
MYDWINSHGFLALLIYWTFANAIGALPTPATTSSGFYQWFYKFTSGLLQVLAANATRVPQVRALMGLQENPTTPEGIEAKQAAQAIDPKVAGLAMKVDPPDGKP